MGYVILAPLKCSGILFWRQLHNKLSLWQFVQDDSSSSKHEVRLLCDAKINSGVTEIKVYINCIL